MASPLTQCDARGVPYTRPRYVEAQIDEVAGFDLPLLTGRVRLRDRDHSDYLRSECLVHIVRSARRSENQAVISLVLPVLLSRCEANLLAKVPDGGLSDAAGIREEILGQLSELFATDGGGERPNELDFFECKFNRAFRAFRIDILRAETVRQAPIQYLPDAEDQSDPVVDDDVFAHISNDFRVPAGQEWRHILTKFRDEFDRLLPEERAAVILVHVMGYKVESLDPTESTAATRCHCKGRTIRNRLARAKAKLIRFKEELVP